MGRVLGAMNNNRTLKKIFNTKPDGVRSVGRPKLWWVDGVDQDIRILGVKNWKEVTLDKDEWAKFFKKARAHQGLSSQWWWWWWWWDTFVDDQVIMADTGDALQISVLKLEMVTSKYGLKISTNKMKTLAFKGRDPVRSKILVNNNNIEQTLSIM